MATLYEKINGKAISVGGGGGASKWADLKDKPFESIGDGLEVDEEGNLNVDVDDALSLTSENTVQNKVITEVVNGLEGKIDNQFELGYLGGKNLLENKGVTTTSNGVTFTVNADGSVLVNGTASANTFFFLNKKGDLSNILKAGKTYKLIALDKSYGENLYVRTGSYSGYVIDIGDGARFAVTQDRLDNADTYQITIRVNSGATINNVLVKPMITEDLDATYNTYSPYSKSNVELTNTVSDIEERGFYSKNLLENKAVSNTSNGITYTVNSDGSVTCNGTANGLSTCSIKGTPSSTVGAITLPAGTYKIRGGYSTNCVVDCQVNGAYYAYPLRDTNQDTFTITEPTTLGYVRIRVASGTTLNNVTVYPMICKADIEDDTYVPYVMSNDELTKYVSNDVSLIDTTNFTKDTLLVQQKGIIKQLIFKLGVSKQLTSNTTYTVANLPINPMKQVEQPFINLDGNVFFLTIKTNGNLEIKPYANIPVGNYKFIGTILFL